jgi:hypothetical protein
VRASPSFDILPLLKTTNGGLPLATTHPLWYQ